MVEGFVTETRPSTKAAISALAGLTGADQTRRRTLVVLERGDDMTWLSLRNVDTVHLLAVDQLNTYDVLLCDDVVFTKAAYDTFVGAHASHSVSPAGQPAATETPAPAASAASEEPPADAAETPAPEAVAAPATDTTTEEEAP